MMIAPDAVTDDGLIEYVRWGPIGRVGLIRNLATLYDGTHTRHPDFAFPFRGLVASNHRLAPTWFATTVPAPVADKTFIDFRYITRPNRPLDACCKPDIAARHPTSGLAAVSNKTT